MKALIVGGGAREHAIARRLAEDAEVYAYMSNKNPGIAHLARGHRIGRETDVDAVTAYAKETGIDIGFIGPEAPLGAGLVDALAEAGIPAVGPTTRAAELETSKSFMRGLMQRHKIPGGVRFGVFSDVSEAAEFIDHLDGRVAVKPVGLTGGKGVRVWGDHFNSPEGALHYAKEVIDERIGGSRAVVIEELLTGEEFTLQAFVDGRTVVPMPLVQDHKRAYEGDRGPNTGGMGSYSMPDGLLPFVPREDVERAVEVMEGTVRAMEKEDRGFRGILYGQFMETADGPRVIEYNVRFGDPEA
ncbi:MAG TPA: phosphoribosylamine--glycine ligase, partial [Thermoplasmata archaeon]|nr:phosphoribosylamine--glycine ligase [Thermoplasmata archaeon]